MAARRITPQEARQAVQSLPISAQLKSRILQDLPTSGTMQASQFGNALAGMIRSSRNPTDAAFATQMTKGMTEAGLNPRDPTTWLEFTALAIAASGAAMAAPAATAVVPSIGSALSGSTSLASAQAAWGTAGFWTKAAVVGAAALTPAAIGAGVIDDEEAARAAQDEPPAPATPEEAAEAAAAGTAELRLTSVDATTGVETPLTLEGQAQQQLQDMLAGMGGGNTLTPQDIAYLTATEQGDPLSMAMLQQSGQALDDLGVWYGNEKPFRVPAPNRVLQSQIDQGLVSQVGPNTYRHKQQFSYREAVRLPQTMSDAEIMRMSKKLWEAGFLPIEGFDYTKTFESQWAADRYDPTFQRAWNDLLRTSLMDPSKPATTIMEERRSKRMPYIERARREAYEQKTKDAMSRLRIPDPATLAETTETKMQELLGRAPTPDERAHILSMMGRQIGQQVQGIVKGDIEGTGTPTTEIDYAARIEDAIEAENPTELGAARVADQFDMFRRLLGGL